MAELEAALGERKRALQQAEDQLQRVSTVRCLTQPELKRPRKSG